MLVMFVLLAAGHAQGLEPLDRKEMAAVSGSGLAVGLQDVRAAFSSTSYIELGGGEPESGVFRRADLRFFGLSLTGTDGGETWAGSCDGGLLNLGCPLGGSIEWLAPFDNPLLLRLYEREGLDFQGNPAEEVVLDLELPTAHEPFRLATWGELHVDPDGDEALLQYQGILNEVDLSGTRLNLLRHTDENNEVPGLIADLHAKADLRFSVNQSADSPDSVGQVPEFTDREGLYLEDFRTHLPLGQPHYQLLTLGGVEAQDGNLFLELTRISDEAAVYDHFYGRTLADDPGGGYDRVVNHLSDTWEETHGFLRWGDWRGGDPIPGYHPDNDPADPRADIRAEFPGGAMPDRSSPMKNPPDSTEHGLFFAARDGNTFQPEVRGNFFDAGPGGTPELVAGEDIGPTDAVNLGDGRVDGVLIQHMKLRSRGAGQ